MSERSAALGPGGRLRGAGTLARAVTILPASLVVPAFIITVLVPGVPNPWVGLIAASLTIPLAVAAVRSRMIGVWLKPDEFVARTWWRTIRIPRADLTSCITVAYRGAFTEGWSVQYLRELEVGTTTYKTFTLGGTIAFAGESNRHRRTVLEYIASSKA